MSTEIITSRAITRVQLCTVGMDVFVRKGFGCTTVEDICERAGCLADDFYDHFASTEELFLALFDTRLTANCERISELLLRLGTEQLTADRMITALLHAKNADDERAWYLVSMEFSLHAIRHPEFAERLALRDAQARDHMVSVLRRVIDRPDAELHRLARMLIVILEGAPAQSLVEPHLVPPTSLEHELLPIVLGYYGVS
ncbi:TetR/AcrR family transcriptional regulator [Pseudonocardiaceae bacterium YIM PH 21723]|nr:TetR/AcrR family transcriptional regulator [Pseudonocardiaceae bacterium YIM PH 21723]